MANFANNNLNAYANAGQLYKAAMQQANVPIKKAVKVETSKELRRKLKDVEKRERAFRKAERRVKAENKAAESRRQIGLDALVRLSGGTGPVALEAAKKLLNDR